MKATRSYRTFSDPTLPLVSYRCVRHRIVPNFINIHWHSHLELLYIPKGSFEIYDKNGNYIAEAGSLCVFAPTKPHCIRSVTQESEYWSMHISPELFTMPDGHFFQEEFVRPLQEATLNMPRCLSPEQCSGKIQEAAHAVIYGKEKWKRFQGAMTLCTQLLPLCSHSKSNHSSIPQGHPAVQECIRYIDTNYATKLTLETLARHVHLHPNYLSSLFKQDCGQTFSAILTQKRVLESRKLLVRTQLSVAQIAESVGFTSSNFYCRKFKQIVGVTPNAYRKNNYQ